MTRRPAGASPPPLQRQAHSALSAHTSGRQIAGKPGVEALSSSQIVDYARAHFGNDAWSDQCGDMFEQGITARRGRGVRLHYVCGWSIGWFAGENLAPERNGTCLATAVHRLL